MQASYDCTTCFFKTDTDSMCLDYQLRIDAGWRFYQEDTAKLKYKYSLQLYTKQSALVHPSLTLPAFMYLDQTSTLDNFEIFGALEFVSHKQAKLFCTNVYIDI